MTFYYSKGNGKAKLIICAIDKLQILLTNYTAVPSTTNFIATNGLPENCEMKKDDFFLLISSSNYYLSTTIIHQWRIGNNRRPARYKMIIFFRNDENSKLTISTIHHRRTLVQTFHMKSIVQTMPNSVQNTRKSVSKLQRSSRNTKTIKQLHFY